MGAVHRRITRRGAGLALVVLAAAATGAAVAAIPAADGTISGCYTNVGGVLRVIDPARGQKCTSVETAIKWSQQGPPGVPGKDGADGAQGPVGPAGADGRDGVTVRPSTESVDVLRPGEERTPSAECPAGQVVTGGGFFISGTQVGRRAVHVYLSGPAVGPTAPGSLPNVWLADFENTGTEQVDIVVTADCADQPSAP